MTKSNTKPAREKQGALIVAIYLPTKYSLAPSQGGFFLLVDLLHTQMGEGRALNTPRMGDVVLINTGDGVFTEQESHAYITGARSTSFKRSRYKT